MVFQLIRPTTPSRRQLTKIKNSDLEKKPFLKKKIKGKKKVTGKNHSGKITVFHKGGGTKKSYREISFHRTFNSTGIVCSLEHDPNRSSFIASIFDLTSNDFFYILAPKNLRVGDIVKSGLDIRPSLGSSLPISEIPVGSYIFSIPFTPFARAQVSRSAGTFSTIKEKTKTHAILELSSGELKSFSLNCFAVIGEASNEFHFLTRLGKAGRSRWLNRRPTVRGVAMNPIDHPHGGGEGKKSGRRKSPWGKPNDGGKTGKSKK